MVRYAEHDFPSDPNDGLPLPGAANGFFAGTACATFSVHHRDVPSYGRLFYTAFVRMAPGDYSKPANAELELPDRQLIERSFLQIRALSNPFRDHVLLQLDLHMRQHVRALIYDVGGRLVRRFFEGTADAGTTVLAWDGRGDGGYPAPSGIYFCLVRGDAKEAGARLTLVR